jgi:ribose transport system permease protein
VSGAEASVEAPARHTASRRGTGIALRVLQSGPLLILGLLVVVMALLSPYFLTGRNLTNLGFQTAIVGVLALGQLLVILTRGIDLSVGSVVALSGVVGGIVAGGSATSAAGGHGAFALLAMAGVGLGIGLVNGIVLVGGRVMNPFIVTLGMLSIVRGAALVLSDAQTVTGMPPVVQDLGTGLVGPLPAPAVLVAALALFTWVVLARTQWGRWIYAVGGNPDAARRVGIPVDRVLLSVFAVCGLAAGIAGILVAGRTNAGAPNAGQLLELDAITAVVIGGASFFGGRGSVPNVVAGALIIGVIRNGLNLLDVTPFWQSIAIGALVIASLEIDVLRGHLEQRLRTAQSLEATG